MSSVELPAPISANLASVIALDESLDHKGVAEPGDGLYPRDGVTSVATIEALVSDVTIPGQVHNVVWASGMSAVRETVQFAAVLAAERGPQTGLVPVIAHARELYAQAGAYFMKERQRGVRVISFDSGSEVDTERVVDRRKADVIFAETVANTPDMPVLNVHRLLEYIRSLDKPPLVILDNTLPLSTGLDLGRLLRPEDPVIVVESGTKNLMNNSELLGASYSPNQELMDSLRKHKAHSGAVNSIGALDSIAEKLRSTIPEFHDRNRAVFTSTAKIALALSGARFVPLAARDFDTTFPTVDPEHANYDYARQISPDGLPFISPVVFIGSTGIEKDANRKLLSRIVGHPALQEQIQAGEIHLGQSFGFAKARLLYDRNAPNIRFAGGYDLVDEDGLADAIKLAVAGAA